ncbi:hypothetical protein [Legionella jordanis]|uniref:Uncharacterized protein n=1 Tax=Legionella jordanis TaxID=456 RepID=A0A0W0VG73_9GAMM|nr:hypothetical protein [Legionella jordanis]KTD19082.1 hypothetical protein Ljor_0048 [Legionella jordanis]VEH12955.1 Uncharacterised protein [Legionella jordanis]
MKKSSPGSIKKEKIKQEDLKNISGGSDERNRNLNDPIYTKNPIKNPIKTPKKPRNRF